MAAIAPERTRIRAGYRGFLDFAALVGLDLEPFQHALRPRGGERGRGERRGEHASPKQAETAPTPDSALAA
jgi:hypothetical protein